jgi:hypothetical protein
MKKKKLLRIFADEEWRLRRRPAALEGDRKSTDRENSDSALAAANELTL